jgi:hypothetical protein
MIENFFAALGTFLWGIYVLGYLPGISVMLQQTKPPKCALVTLGGRISSNINSRVPKKKRKKGVAACAF